MEKKIKSIECKFIIHKPATFDKVTEKMTDDLHFVKEKIHYEDGSSEKRLKVIKDYKRPYWITMEHYRRHKKKKEQELLTRVRPYSATESNLWKDIGRNLNYGITMRDNIRKIKNNPYIYGCDVDSRVFLKKEYETKYPDSFSTYEVACLDIETDIDTEEILCASIARNGEVFTVIVKSWVKKELDFDNRLNNVFRNNIPIKDIKMSYKLVEDELELLKVLINKAHEWQPDFLAVWNINFEMTIFKKLCVKYNVDIKDIMSDPNVPKEQRYFVYKEGQDSRVTASGVRKTYEPKDKWNVVLSSSSFYWIDPMTIYNYIRAGGKKVPTGYGLDSILGHELGKEYKKLKFPNLSDEDEMDNIEWHKFMSRQHPIEYIVYNQWDVLSMLVLDAKTKDLNTTLPILAGINPYEIFNSNPKMIVNEILFVYLENGCVLGSKGVEDDKLDNLGLGGWIVTLQNNLLNVENGKKCIKEYKELDTNIRTHVSDIDQTSGYPSNTIAFNVSGDTTTRSIINIEDENIDTETMRCENINLTMGPVSSLQYCQTMLNFPTLQQLDIFINNRKIFK